MAQALDGIACNRRVGRDHAVDAIGLQRPGNHGDLRFVEVWGDLHQHRYLALCRRLKLQLAFLQARKQGIERRIALQFAQVLGVRTGDIDCDVVGMGKYPFEREQVIVGGPLDRCDCVLADVESDDSALGAEGPGPLHIGQERRQAFVVEAQAIDQGFGFGQAEHPWLVVAGLRFGCHRTDFDEAKTHGAEAVDAAAILVQSGGQADPVGELQSGQLQGVFDPLLRPQALRRGVLQARQRMQGQLMGLLGVDAEQKRAGQGVGDQLHRGIVSSALAA